MSKEMTSSMWKCVGDFAFADSGGLSVADICILCPCHLSIHLTNTY